MGSAREIKMRKFEKSVEHEIIPGMYIVARLDGRSFNKLTNDIMKYDTPFDERFRDAMVEVAKKLFDAGFDIRYAYTESDEISVLLDYKTDDFGRRVEKLASSLAGYSSAAITLILGLNTPVTFDCRIIPLPNLNLLTEYFLWRQEDANRNALNAWCFWTLVNEGWEKHAAYKVMEDQDKQFKNDALFARGINYNDVPSWQKRGVGIYRKDALIVDYELPMKDKYKTYVREIVDGCYSG